MEYFALELNQQRFLRRLGFRINDDDHWMWASTVFKRNSGTRVLPWLWVKTDTGKQIQVYARRFAWEMEHGRRITSEMCVYNVCGEQLCVKPHEKHNIAVMKGSWNTVLDKQEYQLRQGIIKSAPEPTVVRLPDGGISISSSRIPTETPITIPSEEEFLK